MGTVEAMIVGKNEVIEGTTNKSIKKNIITNIVFD